MVKPTAFRQADLVYYVDVPFDQETIEISGEPEVSSATVGNLGLHNLEFGENHFIIPVTGDNMIVRKYHIFVNRSKSHDNLLKSLTVQSGGKTYEYSPEFDPEV